MEEESKLNLEAAVLSYSDFKRRLSCFLRAHSPHQFCLSIGLHHRLTFLEALPEEYAEQTVTYILTTRFKWILKDGEPSVALRIDKYLKEEYVRMVNHKVFQSKSTFELFVIYLVKLTAQFVKRSFRQIAITRSFEGEIYIAVIYLLIGIQVSCKSYLCISSKYFRPILQPHCKLDSRANTNKTITNFKEQIDHSVNDFDVFRQTLLSNLKVKIFPKVEKKKLSIHEYENEQENITEAVSEMRKFELRLPKFLRANQLTSAMALFLNSRSSLSGNAKIQHRGLKAGCKFASQKGGSFKNSREAKEDTLAQNSTQTNWETVLANLKHTYTTTFKLARHQTFSSVELPLFSHEINQRPTNPPSQLQTTHHEAKQVQIKQATVSKGATVQILERLNMGIEPREDRNCQAQASTKMKANLLRRARHRFDLSCLERHNKINKSLFSKSIPQITFD